MALYKLAEPCQGSQMQEIISKHKHPHRKGCAMTDRGLWTTTTAEVYTHEWTLAFRAEYEQRGLQIATGECSSSPSSPWRPSLPPQPYWSWFPLQQSMNQPPYNNEKGTNWKQDRPNFQIPSELGSLIHDIPDYWTSIKILSLTSTFSGRKMSYDLKHKSSLIVGLVKYHFLEVHQTTCPVFRTSSTQVSLMEVRKKKKTLGVTMVFQILEVFVDSRPLNQAIICGFNSSWFTNVEVTHKKYNFWRIPSKYVSGKSLFVAHGLFNSLTLF